MLVVLEEYDIVNSYLYSAFKNHNRQHTCSLLSNAKGNKDLTEILLSDPMYKNSYTYQYEKR